MNKNQRLYYIDKYKETAVPELINRKLIIHKQLERPARTYVVYSDLHGSYEKYLHWLKNGLGHYQIAVKNILGKYYTDQVCYSFVNLLLTVNRTRLAAIEKHIEQEHNRPYEYRDFFSEPVPKKFKKDIDKLEDFGLKRERVIDDLLRLLRGITKEDEHRIIKVIPPQFLENILKLFFKKDRASYDSLITGIVGSDEIYYIVTSILVKLTLINMFDKHINLGDTFDRGDDADRLVSLYRAYFGDDNTTIPLHYLWGNHDILWMGASIGSPMLCATALRISMRYNNIDFLYRYGFNLDKLRSYANECYKLTPTGHYAKAKDSKYWSKEESIKMAKTLLIIEEKLTVNWLKMAIDIPGDIDYTEEYERHRDLLKLLPTDVAEDEAVWKKMMTKNPLFSDVFFPTIDQNNSSELTPEEQEISDDIVLQFTTLPKIQEDLGWIFQKGETYRVVDNTLYYHAAIPATENKELDEIKGYKGKDLLDFIQNDLKRINSHRIEGKGHSIREKVYLWHLWCGSTSPFFCKSKMATLERAVFNKEVAADAPLTSWKESANPYYSNIRDDQFLSMLLSEFHADNVCMGHTPVKEIRDSILSDAHGAFIVDGGASDAYGDRGAVLIKTPDYNYMTMHPSLHDLKEAEKKGELPDFEIHPLEERKASRIRDLDKGFFLKTELQAIDEIINSRIDEFSTKYFY
ncbi:MAG: fructose-bisphosphatase class III [Bacteriovoracaceae bacterium]|nr:fructose-bisphosphatase class III [Bacteriovoracaceae bacterium]